MLNLAYGAALLSAGQPSLAVWPLQKAAKEPKHASQAGLLLAQAQAATDSHAEAISTLDVILALDPENLTAIRLKVTSLLDSRQPELALESVEIGLEIAPDDLGLQMSRMQALLTLDLGEEAGETLVTIRELLDKSDELGPQQRDFLSGRYCAMEAMFTHESGDSEEARQLFTDCLDQYPDHPQVISSAASFLDEIGDPERATEILLDLLERNPMDLSLRVGIASRLTGLGKPEEAEALLREAVETQPYVWSALADHYGALGEDDAAILAMERALATAGDTAPDDWRLHHADLLIQRGRLDEAEEAIDRIEADVYANTGLGRLELARGNPQEALTLLEKGIRLWPDNPMARYLAAQSAEQLGDFDRAETEYREAYRSDPTFTDAGLILAELLASRGRLQEAANLAANHAASNPEDSRGWELAVEYALAARRGDQARAILSRYQKHPSHPSHSTAFAARYLLRTNRPEDALAVIAGSRLNLVDAENLDVLSAWCEIMDAQQHSAEALDKLDELRDRHPDPIAIRALTARILHDSGRIEESSAAYEAILAEDPEHVASLRGLAAIESNRGRTQRAIELFEKAASSDPSDANSLLSAAMLMDPGPLKEERLREALRRNPRDGEAARELLLIIRSRDEGVSPEATDLAERARRFAPDGDSQMATDTGL